MTLCQVSVAVYKLLPRAIRHSSLVIQSCSRLPFRRRLQTVVQYRFLTLVQSAALDASRKRNFRSENILIACFIPIKMHYASIFTLLGAARFVSALTINPRQGECEFPISLASRLLEEVDALTDICIQSFRHSFSRTSRLLKRMCGMAL